MNLAPSGNIKGLTGAIITAFGQIEDEINNVINIGQTFKRDLRSENINDFFAGFMHIDNVSLADLTPDTRQIRNARTDAIDINFVFGQFKRQGMR